MKTRVTINISGIEKKFSQSNLDRGKKFLASEVLESSTPFVPYEHGDLRNSGVVASNGSYVEWNTPYAKKMYYGNGIAYKTAGTGPRWDKKAAGLYMADWENAFKKGAGF